MYCTNIVAGYTRVSVWILVSCMVEW